MYEILERKDHEKYKLLIHINNSEYDDFLLEELSHQLNMSELKLALLIDEILHEVDNPDLLIRRNSKEISKGINFSTEPFLNFYLTKSIKFKLAKDLFYNKYISLRKYSINNNISFTTISRMWRELKDILLKFDIHILKRNKQFVLAGPEEKIRYFFFVLFKHSGEQTFLTLDICHLDFVYESNVVSPSQMKLDNLALILNISIIRAKYKCFIKKEPDYFYSANKLNNPTSFFNILEKFYDKSISEENLTKELTFLYFFINTWTITGKRVTSGSNSYLTTELTKTIDFKVCNDLIIEIINTFHLHLNPDDYFYLIINLMSLKNKQRIFGSLIDLHGNIYNTNNYKKFISELPDDVINQTHISSEQLYIIFCPLLIDNYYSIKLLILSSYGFEEKKYIEKKLAALLPYNVEVVEFINQKPDLIITDYFYNNNHAPVYYLNPYPKNYEFEKLARYIAEKKLYKNNSIDTLV